jgi:peptidyl-prolyl cis-trans isomerase SurA
MHRVVGAALVGMTLLMAGAVPSFAATVRITVNGTPITDVQIQQRLALMKIENRSGEKAAEDELINEALEMQEAKRIGFTITDADVSDAELQLARQLKLSQSNLERVLTDHGVALATLKDRLRANLAWGKIQATAVSARVTVSEADVDKEAKAELTPTNSYDYILKEVLFLTVQGGPSVSARTAQANAYRAKFQGCSTAVQESLGYTDAAVRDIGRRHATQFPDAIASELAQLNVGGITKPRVTESGVQMLAVCSKEVSTDTTYLADKIRQTQGNGALKGAADKNLAELKAKAQIIRN